MPLSKSIETQIRKLCQQYPNEVAKYLLESNFWLREVSVDTYYEIHDDDTLEGKISVFFSFDSDGWIEVQSTEDSDDPSSSHRFKSYFDGGRNHRVRSALLLLALGIKLDNEEHPIHRPVKD